MNGVLVETRTTLRRLARRRAVLAVAGVDLAAVLGRAWLDPAPSARAAIAEASALAALTVVVLAAGLVADDRAAGRLALAATHPVRRAGWVAGRWLAVCGAAAAVLAAAAAVPLAAGAGPFDPPRIALGWAAGVAFAAALSALAVALSCRVGASPQVLLLVALLVVGTMPPEIVTHALHPAWQAVARAAWSLLPTPWALGTIQDRVWGGGAMPLPAVALPAQAAAWLWVGGRLLEQGELGSRSS